MHILISGVSSARQPSGICRHAANLAKSLSLTPEVSRVTLLVGRWQLAYFREAFGLNDSATLRFLPIAIRNHAYARNAWYYGTLPRIAQSERADIVHLTFPAPVQRARFACPVVSALHDLYPYDVPQNFGRVRVVFNRLFLAQCLKSSDAVVCSSDFTLERLRQYAPKLAEQKATRIYQSVTFASRDQQPPAERVDGSFLLAVAQHRRNKNLHLLLAAFAELRKASASARQMQLLIVGAEGPETTSLRAQIARLSLNGNVLFQSALSDAELCWLYARCALLIVPSSIEGFCLPVVEALGCGSRVLCSDIPVLREIGGSSCRYFSLVGDNPAGVLAQAIDNALLQPAPQRLITDHFSPREVAREYVALYSRLLAGVRESAVPTDISHLDPIRYGPYAS